MRTARLPLLALVTGSALGVALLPPAAAADVAAQPRPPARAQLADPPAKVPVAVGRGGAVATVDPDATRVGLEVLAAGGNAVDAAVAAAAMLGVTEPYSAGIGGGGFFVHYDAETGRVRTIDGRETAPQAMDEDSFVVDGAVLPFPEAVTSGLSAGVPGTPATWELALQRWGTLSLRQALRGAERVARRGFVVDETFRAQTAANEARFRDVVPTRELFLPGGELPVVGSRFHNPDLARTYRLLRRQGTRAFYGGQLARDMVQAVQEPPVDPAADRRVRPGLLRLADLASYDALVRTPTRSTFRGLDVYGMAPPSSGGVAVGEALNIIEELQQREGATRSRTAHHYLEASALAFADRGRYLGDPAFTDVPVQGLLSQGYAKDRAACVTRRAAPKPVPAGVPSAPRDGECGPAAQPYDPEREGRSTTHLTVADSSGDVVSYTLTIESTGGNGIVVPGRGFLLNNELTDFSIDPAVPSPNQPGPGKRPRSSMSPTIVLRDGQPLLALGSPGGATIITTVLQVLVDRLELGSSLPDAIAAPRASQRNTATVEWEPGLRRASLLRRGHVFAPAPTPEIGAATGIELLADGRLLAAAEPTRRGGGSAGVVRPDRP